MDRVSVCMTRSWWTLLARFSRLLSGSHSRPAATRTIKHTGVFIFGGIFHLISPLMKGREHSYFLPWATFHVFWCFDIYGGSVTQPTSFLGPLRCAVPLDYAIWTNSGWTLKTSSLNHPPLTMLTALPGWGPALRSLAKSPRPASYPEGAYSQLPWSAGQSALPRCNFSTDPLLPGEAVSFRTPSMEQNPSFLDTEASMCFLHNTLHHRQNDPPTWGRQLPEHVSKPSDRWVTLLTSCALAMKHG